VAGGALEDIDQVPRQLHNNQVNVVFDLARQPAQLVVGR
jgi:hypothetical protein